MNFLIVDDILTQRKFITSLINVKFGDKIKCDEASNGDEAIEMATKNKYDVVLMDIIMPNKDGIDATSEINIKIDKNKKPKLIAITADSEFTPDDLNEAGFDYFIEKPFSLEKLENFISIV